MLTSSIAQFLIIFLAHVVIEIFGSCPNNCNGHGACSLSNTCLCYTGWGSADCSQSERFLVFGFMLFIPIYLGVCPTNIAWVDKAYGVEEAHQLAICSNAGSCDYSTGKCNCFDGFAGDACERSN